MGRCQVRARKGASPELRKATSIGAIIFAYAKSHKQFEKTVRATLAEGRLELVDLEDAGPADELLDIDPDKFGCAVETAKTGSPAFMLEYTDEPLDAVNQHAEPIRTAAASDEVVQFRLVGGDDYYMGVVVEVSDTWALLNKVSLSGVAFDGYDAVRFDEIIDASVIDSAHTFISRALQLRGELPTNPRVPLDGHRTLLTEQSKRYPLVTLADTTRHPDTVVIGRITTIEDDKMTLLEVDSAGEWTGEHDHSYKKIAMISFGSVYEAALASVLE